MWIGLIMHFIVVDKLLLKDCVDEFEPGKIYNNKILIALKVRELFVTASSLLTLDIYTSWLCSSMQTTHHSNFNRTNAAFSHEIETKQEKKWIILKLKPFLALRFHSIKKTAKQKQRRSGGLITTQPETFRKKIIIKKMMENGAHEIATATAPPEHPLIERALYYITLRWTNFSFTFSFFGFRSCFFACASICFLLANKNKSALYRHWREFPFVKNVRRENCGV